MNTQAETTDTQRAEDIAARLEVKPDPKKDEKDKKKSKKKEKEPTKEDIQAAVAGVVLAEMKFWPEEVVSLIGEQHPNKDSFLKGVAYVIGGYMHFARKALDEIVKKRKKEAELRACELLGPVSQKLAEVRKEFTTSRDSQIADLKKQRDEELKAAAAAINEKYEKLLSEARGRELPEEGQALVQRDADIKEAFNGACSTIDKEAAELRAKIEEIEEARESWNSKKRRSRRAAVAREEAAAKGDDKDGAQPEEAVE